MDYSNLNIDKFEYSIRIEEESKNIRKRTAKENIGKRKEDRSSASERLIRRKAVQAVRELMIRLKRSEVEEYVLLSKQMKLEAEYISKKEKEELIHKIETVTKLPAAGVYTLAEIGDCLGVTRERVRQLEDSAVKVLKHPQLKRELREHMEGLMFPEPNF